MLSRFALAAALALSALSVHATTYTIDPRHTQGVLSWNHLGFSNPSAQFSLVQGTLQFDPTHPTASTVQVTIALANLRAGVPELDDYLRDADFFDVAKFPSATFRSTSVETAAAPATLTVRGELTVRGATKPVALEVKVNKVGTDPRSDLSMAGFEATTVLKRSDFGMGKYVGLVSDDVQIHITCQAIESKGYARHLQAGAAKAVQDAAQKAVAARNAADEAAGAERDAAQQVAFAKYAAETAGVAKDPAGKATANSAAQKQ